MVVVHCRTSLDDVMMIERWPTELPARPVFGDLIRSETKHGDFRLELQVVGCTWVAICGVPNDKRWMLEVELHMPDWQRRMSIAEWQTWYRKARSYA